MSPIVRDGRRERHEFAVPDLGVGPGPVTRRHAKPDEANGFTSHRPAGGLPGPVAIASRFVAPTPESDEEDPVSEEPVPEIRIAPVDERLEALAAAAADASKAWIDLELARHAWARATADLQAAWQRTEITGSWAIDTIWEEARASVALDGEPRVAEAGQLPAGVAQEERGAPSAEVPGSNPGPRSNSPVPEPVAAAGGGPEVPPDRLGRSQRRILSSSIAHDGDRKAVAAELGISVGNVETQLEYIGKKGLLPLTLIQRLPARFAKYTGV